ncbi:M14 family metallopeptidase [Undibacterium sp. LX40W]|uniref:M14 family metallopeptidase n=1 Tax=Undibacterium nitidum TaxID=2762298 RepID=A0A923KK91_9BURK|nr:MULTISPECIES: M14 family metallopeptidase [Undibacterium]MBC3880530.1 M14 family metallopeptidase [Undibacterium nitidum]MBC3890734.1 M14 family metallopeptidase [Undibacterium sp. LX40W]
MFASLFLSGVATISSLATAADLQTKAEKTGFQETGRYEEVIRLCHSFAKQYPQFVKCEQFGETPEGRPMHVLIASKSGSLSVSQAKQKRIPVVLIQGGIHAGEIDGKDAGFLALRQVLENQAAADALKHQILLFVPVFNVDGHERFSTNNRPNQRGPKAMGWRTTAQNFNLNRDYLKADAPEMQAMLKLVNRWDPVAVVDLHVTDGAKFEHDVSIQVEPSLNQDHPLADIGRQFQDAVISDLAKHGSLPLPFYMSFDEEDNPMSGFSNNVSTPRFSTGYFQLRNRLAMLVETHSWKDYPTRVRITRNTIISVLEQIDKNGKAWQQQQKKADIESSKMTNQALALSYKNTDKSKIIEFKGYAYNRSLSEISGGQMTRYDETKPEIWRVKLQEELTPDIVIKLPGAGYIIPKAWAVSIEPKLNIHGIRYSIIKSNTDTIPLETFTATKITFSPQSIEHHQMLAVEGEWQTDQGKILAGSLFVPSGQAKARLIAQLFEPKGGDSLLNWGYFNNAFEMKEYMEAYVTEEFAREALQSSPTLRKEFDERLLQDPEFKNNPSKRLSFFARLHPSWDTSFGKYPVIKVNASSAILIR